MTRTRLLDGLGTMLDENLARLPAPTLAALEVGAVLGREFSAADVATIGGLPIDDVHARLLDARAARVVSARGHGDADRLLFSHVLLRDRIYEQMLPSRRATLHWLAGSAMLGRGGDPATAAHHLIERHGAGEPGRAAEVALGAANSALARFAFEEAAQLCRRASGLLGHGAGPSRLACELSLTLAQALMRAGDAAEGKKACIQASELDQRVAVMNSSGWYIGALLGRGQLVQAEIELRSYEALLAEFPQPHFQWGLPLARALAEAFRGNFAAADRLSDEAHALAERGGSGPGLRAWATQRVAFAQMRGQPDSIARDANEIMAVYATVQSHVPSWAWVRAAIGEHAQAARQLRTTQIEPSYFPAVIIAADACAMLADRELAAALYPPLLAASGAHAVLWGPAGASAFGPTSRVLGDLATLMGRPEDAVRHYDEAIALCERIGALPFVELVRRSRERALAGSAEAPRRTAPPAAETPPRVDLRREGDVWVIESSTGPDFRLRHSKGLAYLQYLVSQPGREVHVLELAGVDHAAGDAGPALDSRAKAEYRRRVDELKDEVQEAERFGDAFRRRRAEDELEAIAQQIAGAVGQGGRDRLAASDSERARINVQRRLKDSVERIASHDPALARYLAAALQTGTYCSFVPR